MKRNAHSHRYAEQAREKLGIILSTKVSDPALEQVTLTGCDVSVDKSLVRAYIACPESSEEEVLRALKRAKGHIRTLLGHSLGWRVTPELDLRIDPSTKAAERITRALQTPPPTINQPKDEDGQPIPLDRDSNGALSFRES